MATYKEIKGVTIQTRDSDPVEFIGSWSSQPTLNTTRSQAAGFGTASNMGAAGGNTGSLVTNFELWNGTSWTEINDTSVAAMDSGFGPSGKASSAMFITGDTASGRVNSTEMFDASLANKTITAS